MLMRLSALLIFFLALPPLAGATAQIPDQIVLDGRPHALFSEPFNAFLDKHRDEVAKLESFLGLECSGSWRGYQAHWEIRDQKLVLTALFADPCADHPAPIPLSIFFPATSGPAYATWFSGKLIVPQGERIEYVHMGYQSRYASYLIITVKEGLVVGTEHSTNPR